MSAQRSLPAAPVLRLVTSDESNWFVPVWPEAAHARSGHALARDTAGSGAWPYAAVITVFAVALALWRGLVVQQVVGDAASRTFSAVSALYSYEPHLAAIGFIWPPLPVTAQLPLLALHPSLARYGLSGNLVSAIFCGLSAVPLAHLCRRLGLGRWVTFALVLGLFGNPDIWYYGSNGMSEMPFVYFLLVVCETFVTWSQTGRWQSLVYLSLACAGMLLCRYDAVVVTAAVALGVGAVLLCDHERFSSPKVEAHLLAVIVPVVYTTALWVYFNALIMGDPLYFWHSEYSNQYLTREMLRSVEVQALRASPAALLSYFLAMTGGLSPLFLAMLVVGALRALWKRDVVLASLLPVMLAAPLFQLWSYRSGSTFGFSRFYISVIPSGIVLAAYVYARTRRFPPQLKLTLLIAGLAASNMVTLRTVASQEPGFAAALASPLRTQGEYRGAAAAAAYLDAHARGRSVLIDEGGRSLVLFAQRPWWYYLPSDSDWATVIHAPQQYPVTYVVAVRQQGPLEFNTLVDLYPSIFERGLPFATVEASFDGIRIFRVNGR